MILPFIEVGKRGSVIKHTSYAGIRSDIPVADILIERQRVLEHIIQQGCTAGIPIIYVLIECSGIRKHTIEVGNR